jgi:hypothetical protein
MALDLFANVVNIVEGDFANEDFDIGNMADENPAGNL